MKSEEVGQGAAGEVTGASGGKPGNSGGNDHGHQDVVVKVNTVEKTVKKLKYLVTDFKVAVGVSPELVLDQMIDGVLTELKDQDTLHIKGGEEFISHVRQGGSS